MTAKTTTEETGTFTAQEKAAMMIGNQSSASTTLRSCASSVCPRQNSHASAGLACSAHSIPQAITSTLASTPGIRASLRSRVSRLASNASARARYKAS